MKDYWYGHRPLWKAFWLIYVLLGIILPLFAIPVLFLLGAINSIDEIFIIIFFYEIFAFVSVWRCAENAEKHWMVLARVFITATAFGQVAMLS